MAIPQALYTDCQTCRITGTATFSAVGVYALTVARSQAKTRFGKATASAAGLGKCSRRTNVQGALELTSYLQASWRLRQHDGPPTRRRLRRLKSATLRRHEP